jgi:hypothetical protein
MLQAALLTLRATFLRCFASNRTSPVAAAACVILATTLLAVSRSGREYAAARPEGRGESGHPLTAHGPYAIAGTSSVIILFALVA